MSRVFSYGGGVQSTAALVLAAQKRIDFPTFLFANVGDDSEHPATLRYVREVALPYAAEHGIQLEELHRVVRGERRTLMQQLTTEQRSLSIPVRMDNGAPGHRTCTTRFKIDVVARWGKAHGVTVVGLGISTDEWHRAKDSMNPAYTHEFPLLDLNLRRADCQQVIRDAGLPVPPKSACYFCPFKSRGDWLRMKQHEPDLFERAVAVEDMLNARRANLGKDAVYLHASAKPLALAVGDQANFDDLLGECDSGYCWT